MGPISCLDVSSVPHPFSGGRRTLTNIVCFRTAWWNFSGWVSIIPGLGQGATNFLDSALEIQYPNSNVIVKDWFPWVMTAIGVMFGAFLPNVLSQGTLKWTLRCTVVTFFSLFFMYWIWLPVGVARNGHFQSSSVFTMFYNGTGNSSNSYAWLVGVLFGAWEVRVILFLL